MEALSRYSENDGRICPECGSSVLKEESNGDIVCTGCGLVLENNPFFDTMPQFYSDPASGRNLPSYHSYSTNTMIGTEKERFGKYNRFEKYQEYCNRFDYVEYEALELFKKLIAHFTVPFTPEMYYQVFRDIYNGLRHGSRARSVELLGAVVFYYITKRNGIYIPRKKIQNLLSIPDSRINAVISEVFVRNLQQKFLGKRRTAAHPVNPKKENSYPVKNDIDGSGRSSNEYSIYSSASISEKRQNLKAASSRQLSPDPPNPNNFDLPLHLKNLIISLMEKHTNWSGQIKLKTLSLTQRFYTNLMKLPLAMKDKTRVGFALYLAQKVHIKKHVLQDLVPDQTRYLDEKSDMGDTFSRSDIRNSPRYYSISIPTICSFLNIAHSTLYAWINSYDIVIYGDLYGLVKINKKEVKNKRN